MATNYPAALDTTAELPNTRADGTTSATNHAADHNNLSDAVRAVEAELGTNPKGGSADVKARFAALDITVADRIPKSLFTAKGSIVTATGSGVPVEKVVGANGQVLTADSAQTDGLVWKDPRGSIGLAWTGNPMNYHTTTTIPDGANRGVYVRATQGGVITKVGIIVGTASGNISVAVFDNTGAGTAAAPNNRKGTTGAVVCPAAGYREISLGGSVTVEVGDWFFLSADNITATFYRFLGAAAVGLTFLCVKQATAHPAPAAAGVLAADDRPFVIVGIA